MDMKEPTLVIMAAGMGSRYGGLKQMDPIDPQGHVIIDFSIYDALRAGFQNIVFIIKREMEADFRAIIGDRIAKKANVSYVYQDLQNLPDGFSVPEGRVKPWGTGHAILSIADVVDGPFAVINADDYYGPAAYQKIYDYLTTHEDDALYRYAMVGFLLKNTLSENGHVARGVCQVSDEGYLTDIHERTHIEKREDGAAYTEDDGKTFTSLSGDCTVSMNLWGFTNSILTELKDRFPAFLTKAMEENPLKGEYFLPSVVGDLLKEGKATVQVLTSTDRWYGVTYKADKAVVTAAIQQMKDQGLYPQNLWD
jgi:NDP-sugar pyrophosphorylase family protein